MPSSIVRMKIEIWKVAAEPLYTPCAFPNDGKTYFVGYERMSERKVVNNTETNKISMAYNGITFEISSDTQHYRIHRCMRTLYLPEVGIGKGRFKAHYVASFGSQGSHRVHAQMERK